MVDEHNRLNGDCFPLDFEKLGGTDTAGVATDQLYETIQRMKREDHGLPIIVYPELDREAMRTYYAEPAAFTHKLTPSCAWISTDILPNGDVSPCFDLVVGNVLRQSFRKHGTAPPSAITGTASRITAPTRSAPAAAPTFGTTEDRPSPPAPLPKTAGRGELTR